MQTFPISRPVARDYYSEELYRRRKRTDYEKGSVQIRPVYTKTKKKFTIGWKNLSDTEYMQLVIFFEENIGKDFIWVDFRGEQHIVFFSDDKLSGIKSIGFRAGETVWDTGKIAIEER